MPPAILAILAKAIRSRVFWLALVAIALTTTIGVQSWRLDQSQQLVTALKGYVEVLKGRVTDDARKLTQRDALIAEQNQAVQAIATKSAKDQAAYEARIAQANAKAARLQSSIDRAKSFQASNPADPAVTQAELLTMIRETVREYQKERAQ